MDVVRRYFRAVNASAVESIAALYDPHCIVENAWVETHARVEGAAAVRDAWAEEFARYGGLLAGAHRVDATRIAGIETGWGWVRAEWTRSVVARADGRERHAIGYTHFWIEDGLIRRQRTIAEDVPAARLREPRPTSERRYPSRPLVGIGAVIFSAAGEVLLVKRRHEPLAGQWSLPGGMLELGETLEAGVVREIEEETGLTVGVGPVVEVFDRILLDDAAKVRYHFVLIDYLCDVRGGDLQAGSDVEAAAFVAPDRVREYVATEKARDVIAQAVAMRSNSKIHMKE
jgi:ADP-ribose pyrophosphatase YjhB (NUDIX family)